MYYVTDAHSLIWYLSDDGRLGKNASAIFEKADNGEVIIIVPTIALAEIIHICEKRKIDLKIKEVVEKIHSSSNLENSISLKKVSDIHDRIIVATTKMLKAKLISKDKEIIGSKEVETIW